MCTNDTKLPGATNQESTFSLFTDDDESRIDRALDRQACQDEILSSKFNLNIFRHDMLTLSGHNWLNDQIINFYMCLLVERGKRAEWPSVYAMNTFFYPKLKKSGYVSLRRWTRQVDLFMYDIIAIPIHLGFHWCMAIINVKQKTVKYYDNMGFPNGKCLKLLFNYLCDEHLAKKGTDFDKSGWKLENVRDIPQQMNGGNCGVFACTFAEFVTRYANITFTHKDMIYLRRKMVLEILNGELINC